MKKLSCIVVDDEPVARKILKEFIEQVPFLELTAEFENVIKTEAFLKEHSCDLLFLDIEMPKLSGLEFLRNSPVHAMVILTTAYPKYALEGYELDIIDYLLKPIAFNRFLKSVHKAKEFSDLKDATAKDNYPPYLFVRSERRIEKIEVGKILYIESIGNYIGITTEQKKILAYLTLKAIESQLPAKEFIKPHQSFLVNFSKVESIEGNQMKVRDKMLPISRNYRDTVMQLVEKRMLKR
jgi:DNA-binding LytR/AlgR family response regulator